MSGALVETAKARPVLRKIASFGVHGHVSPLLIWTILWAAFFGTILGGAARFPTSDFSTQFHAFGLFQAREMTQGRLPVWSPGSRAGTPFAGDPQAAVFYPPRWLTILLSRPWGFSYYALEVEALAHVWLAGAFTYALAYSITRRRLAGLLAAVAFGLGGYLTSYPLLQLAILEALTWLPLALLFVRRAATQPRPAPSLVASGLALALTVLAGHPQTWLHVAYVVAAYYLFVTLRAGWRWPWVLGRGALVAGLGIGVSAACWWPALTYMLHSTRTTAYQFVSGGLPLLDYLQLLVPGVLSHWVPEYLGMASAVFMVMVWLGRRSAQRAEIVFWATMAATAGWLALGDAGVLYELAYRAAPGFALFRGQERLLGVASLAGAILASQGMALWLSAKSPPEVLRRSAGVVAGGMALAGVILTVAPSLASGPWMGVWVRQTVVLLVVLALLVGGTRRSWRGLVLVLILAVDLYVATYISVDRQAGAASVFWPQPAWLASLRTETPSRLDSNMMALANIGEVYGLEDVRGTSPLNLQIATDLRTLPKTRFWQLLNVSYVLASKPAPDLPLTKVAEITENLIPDRPLKGAVYRFDAALSRAWMVYRSRRVLDARGALAALADESFDAATEVILLDKAGLPEVSPPRTGGPEAQVAIQRLGPGALRVRVDTRAAGYLVLSEWNYPGWRATLDDRPAPMVPADYALQALWVPEGEHEIVFRYVSEDVLRGGVLSLVSVVISAILAWRWRAGVGSRRQKTSPEAAVAPDPAQCVLPEEMERTVSTERRQPTRWGALALLLLLLLGFGLRVFRLGYQELRGDEAFSYLIARRPGGEIIPVLLQQGDPHSPLHYLFLHAWMDIAGASESAMRFPSVLMGALLLPLMFALGHALRGKKLGLLLAGLAAISESLLWLAQDVRSQYLLTIVFSTLATLLFVRALRRPSWHAWALYAFACALTAYSHYYGIFALLAHGLYFLAEPASRRQVGSWLASGALAALLFAPWALAMWPNLVAVGQLSAPDRPELAQHLATIGTHLAVGSAFGSPAGRWLFVWGLVLGLAGAREILGRKRGWGVLLVGWLSIAALGTYLLRFSRQTFNPFYIAVAAPAWWSLVGLGIVSLWRRRSMVSRALSVASVLALIAANGISLYHYYSDPAYSRTAGYRKLADYLRSQAKPGDVFVANFPDPRFDYYLDGVPLSRTMQPATLNGDAQTTGQALEALSARYDRLWFVPAFRSVWDPKDLAYHWLDERYLLEREKKVGHIQLLAYRPLRSITRVLAPLDVSLDGLLRLEGAWVTVKGEPARLDGSPVKVPAGATVKVTLAWRGLTRIPQGYTVFVHLLGADGKIVAQHDGWPAGGRRPTITWAAGELILDRHELTVPREVAADRGTILVGLYQSETLERQVLSSGRDSVVLAPVLYEAR